MRDDVRENGSETASVAGQLAKIFSHWKTACSLSLTLHGRASYYVMSLVNSDCHRVPKRWRIFKLPHSRLSSAKDGSLVKGRSMILRVWIIIERYCVNNARRITSLSLISRNRIRATKARSASDERAFRYAKRENLRKWREIDRVKASSVQLLIIVSGNGRISSV